MKTSYYSLNIIFPTVLNLMSALNEKHLVRYDRVTKWHDRVSSVHSLDHSNRLISLALFQMQLNIYSVPILRLAK